MTGFVAVLALHLVFAVLAARVADVAIALSAFLVVASAPVNLSVATVFALVLLRSWLFAAIFCHPL